MSVAYRPSHTAISSLVQTRRPAFIMQPVDKLTTGVVRAIGQPRKDEQPLKVSCSTVNQQDCLATGNVAAAAAAAAAAAGKLSSVSSQWSSDADRQDGLVTVRWLMKADCIDRLQRRPCLQTSPPCRHFVPRCWKVE